MPKELAADDLTVINSMMRIGEITSDFARVNADPLAAMLALDQYSQTVLNLENAFIDIGNIYKTDGISLSAGTPGASFVNLISDMEAKQKAITGSTSSPQATP